MTEQWLHALLHADTEDGIRRAVVPIDGVDLPVALRTSPGNDRLLILYNGAVDRARASDGVVFQRSSWAEEIQASCLWIADPSLLPRPGAILGWGQISEEAHLPDLIPHLVASIGEALNISPARRLHFGSSAGGFQALVCAAADAGSTALVNNPQTDWLRYEPRGPVDRVLSDVFAGRTREQLVADMPWRARAWDWFDRAGHVPRTTYVVNTASSDDMLSQLAPFQRALEQMHPSNPGVMWEVQHYFDPVAGHSPLARRPALININEMLSRL